MVLLVLSSDGDCLVCLGVQFCKESNEFIFLFSGVCQVKKY